ncbi:hypothetical protein [Saccharothrix sp. HUAS TT1]|uniref:hypothetical protein n=1 Tax=unclassified Saccharothrix TaxID=2593673 RepID=UPI00345C2FBD
MAQHGPMDPVVKARCLDLTRGDVEHPRIWGTRRQVEDALPTAGNRWLRPMRARNRFFFGWCGAQLISLSDQLVTVRFLVQDGVGGVLTCPRPTDVDPPEPRALTAAYVDAHRDVRMRLRDAAGPVDATLLLADGSHVVYRDHDLDRVVARRMATLWPETVEVHEIGYSAGSDETTTAGRWAYLYDAWCSCGRFAVHETTAGARRLAVAHHLRAGGAA